MILLCILFSLMLPFGQVLWKLSLIDHPLGKSNIFGLLFSWQFICGSLVYVLATGLYMYILGKYPYSVIQPIVVSLSLVASIAAAHFYFKEHFGLLNIVGLVILLIGLVLVTRK